MSAKRTGAVVMVLAGVVGPAGLGGCAGGQQRGASAAEAAPAPGTLAYDKSVFGALLDDHAKIKRTVREIPGGIEATTESDDPAVAARLRDHVGAMKSRIEQGRRLRQWDPIYVAVFDEAEKITLEVEATPRGVRVRETSGDERVAGLIRAHARVVSGFVEHGAEEAGREHPVPGTP